MLAGSGPGGGVAAPGLRIDAVDECLHVLPAADDIGEPDELLGCLSCHGHPRDLRLGGRELERDLDLLGRRPRGLRGSRLFRPRR